jgi:hypothetical protein
MPLKLKTKEQIIEEISENGNSEKFCNKIDFSYSNSLKTGEQHPFFDGEYEKGIYRHPQTGEELTEDELNDSYNRIDSRKHPDKYKHIQEYRYHPTTSDQELDKIQEMVSDNDGDGNERRRVYHIPEIDLWFKLIGTYSSWDSSSWDCVEVVVPKQKTITVYEPA